MRSFSAFLISFVLVCPLGVLASPLVWGGLSCELAYLIPAASKDNPTVPFHMVIPQGDSSLFSFYLMNSEGDGFDATLIDLATGNRSTRHIASGDFKGTKAQPQAVVGMDVTGKSYNGEPIGFVVVQCQPQ